MQTVIDSINFFVDSSKKTNGISLRLLILFWFSKFQWFSFRHLRVTGNHVLRRCRRSSLIPPTAPLKLSLLHSIVFHMLLSQLFLTLLFSFFSVYLPEVLLKLTSFCFTSEYYQEFWHYEKGHWIYFIFVLVYSFQRIVAKKFIFSSTWTKTACLPASKASWKLLFFWPVRITGKKTFLIWRDLKILGLYFFVIYII